MKTLRKRSGELHSRISILLASIVGGGPLDREQIREVVAKMDEATEDAYMVELIKKRIRRLEEKGS